MKIDVPLLERQVDRKEFLLGVCAAGLALVGINRAQQALDSVTKPTPGYRPPGASAPKGGQAGFGAGPYGV